MIIRNYLAILAALTIYEWFRSLTAILLGINSGNLRKSFSLNPLRHFDAFGSLILPLLMLLTSYFLPASIPGFAYAKRHSITDNSKDISLLKRITIAFSGSLICLFMAYASAITLVTIKNSGIAQGFLIFFTEINLLFAIINLIPILPLEIFRIFCAYMLPEFGKKIVRFRLLNFIYIFLFLQIPFLSSLHAYMTFLFTKLVRFSVERFFI